MKTLKLQELCDKLGGKVWQKGEMYRIYFNTDKSAKAYLDFDSDASVRNSDEVAVSDEGIIEDSRLCVFSNCASQSTKWNVNRSKQIKHELMLKISALTGCKVCENWQEVL